MYQGGERWLWGLAERTVESVKIDGVIPRSPFILRDALAWALRVAYERGRQDALMGLRTTAEVAEELGVDRTTVYRRALRLGIGWRFGRDLLLRQEDVERLGR